MGGPETPGYHCERNLMQSESDSSMANISSPVLLTSDKIGGIEPNFYVDVKKNRLC